MNKSNTGNQRGGPKIHRKGKKKNEPKNDGIKVATWSKGGAWNTNFDDKKDEIEIYLKREGEEKGFLESAKLTLELKMTTST
jgi:hypothetical protein